MKARRRGWQLASQKCGAMVEVLAIYGIKDGVELLKILEKNAKNDG